MKSGNNLYLKRSGIASPTTLRLEVAKEKDRLKEKAINSAAIEINLGGSRVLLNHGI